MTKLLIATIRSIILGSVLVTVYAFWLAVSFLAWPFGEIKQELHRLVFRAGAKMIARVIGMRLNIQGTPPNGPFLMVSNHLSYVDIVAFASQSNCTFIAKHEVSKWPLIGLLARSMNTIFIDRTNRNDIPRVISATERALSKGQNVILFAEGTSSPGETVLPFNSSLLQVAAKLKCPVSYASLTYETPVNYAPAYLSVCWWGDMTFPDHLFNLLKLPFFKATLTYGEMPVPTGDRKILARELWQRVSEQFNPVVRQMIGAKR